MKKPIKVSVGISVYNESENIKNLLISLLTQKENVYKLVEIIVISDGSTDPTVARIKEIKDPRIKVYVEKQRQGQNIRLNQILSTSLGEVLVILEGDLIADEFCLEELVKPYLDHKDVVLTHGTNQSIEVKKGNFWTKVFTFIDTLKINSLYKLNNGENIYIACSCRALCRKLIREFRYPADVPEDSYLYLYCKKNQLKIVYQPKAVSFFRSPGNIPDYFRKTDKYNKGKEKLADYFPDNLIKSAFFMPKYWLITFFIQGFISHPVYFSSYLLSLLLSKIYLLTTSQFNPLWEVSDSTKKLST